MNIILVEDSSDKFVSEQEYCVDGVMHFTVVGSCYEGIDSGIRNFVPCDGRCNHREESFRDIAKIKEELEKIRSRQRCRIIT